MLHEFFFKYLLQHSGLKNLVYAYLRIKHPDIFSKYFSDIPIDEPTARKLYDTIPERLGEVFKSIIFSITGGESEESEEGKKSRSDFFEKYKTYIEGQSNELTDAQIKELEGAKGAIMELTPKSFNYVINMIRQDKSYAYGIIAYLAYMLLDDLGITREEETLDISQSLGDFLLEFIKTHNDYRAKKIDDAIEKILQSSDPEELKLNRIKDILDIVKAPQFFSISHIIENKRIDEYFESVPKFFEYISKNMQRIVSEYFDSKLNDIFNEMKKEIAKRDIPENELMKDLIMQTGWKTYFSMHAQTSQISYFLNNIYSYVFKDIFGFNMDDIAQSLSKIASNNFVDTDKIAKEIINDVSMRADTILQNHLLQLFGLSEQQKDQLYSILEEGIKEVLKYLSESEEIDKNDIFSDLISQFKIGELDSETSKFFHTIANKIWDSIPKLRKGIVDYLQEQLQKNKYLKTFLEEEYLLDSEGITEFIEFIIKDLLYSDIKEGLSNILKKSIKEHMSFLTEENIEKLANMLENIISGIAEDYEKIEPSEAEAQYFENIKPGVYDEEAEYRHLWKPTEEWRFLSPEKEEEKLKEDEYGHIFF